MLDCIILLFERYQTFIVGLMGFAGVIYAMSKNAKLARTQHEREKDHEKLAIKNALTEELKFIRNSYRMRIKDLSSTNEGTSMVLLNVFNDVYLQLISKIGVLEPEKVKLVMNAYLAASELPSKIKFLAIESPHPDYLQFPSSEFPRLIEIHESHLTEIEQALSAINENFK